MWMLGNGLFVAKVMCIFMGMLPLRVERKTEEALVAENILYR